MMDLANSGSLYPRQIDLLDRWLCGWHDMLQLDDRYDATLHNFVIDLSADHGARRLRKPDTGKPMRFWSTSDLLQKMQETQTALHAGEAPAQLGQVEIARTAENLELLGFLQHQWAALEAREQRRAPRESVKRLVDVAHGINAIVNQFKAAAAFANVSPYGSALNYNDVDDVQVHGFITDRTRDRASQMHAPLSPASPDVERWVMHDESECGYGAIIETRDKDWLRVAALIGIKSHDVEQWTIGIVRRLSRVDEDTSSIGIETLAEMPTLAMLHDTTTPGYTVNGFDHIGSGLSHASLWLDSNPNSVVIDPIHFTPGKVTEFIRSAADGRFLFLETSARVGGAFIVDLVEAESGLNLWREWAKLEIAGEDGTYRVPQAADRYAGLVLTLAKQEWPDLTGYTDPEIVYRVKKANHAGLIVASPDESRVRALLDQSAARFRQDFYASVPAPDRPPA